MIYTFDHEQIFLPAPFSHRVDGHLRPISENCVPLEIRNEKVIKMGKIIKRIG